MSASKSRALCLVMAMTMVLSSQSLRAELVGWWTFDDVTGSTVPDSSGFMNDGTLEGFASISDDVPAFLGTGGSLMLEGFDDHVLVDDSDSLDIDEAITIAAWVKPIGNVEWDGIVAKSPSDDSSLNHAGNYELRIENGSRTLTFLNQQGGVDDTITYGGGPAIAEGEWQHVAVTVNEDGVTFYKNGLQQSTRPLGGAMYFGEINDSPLYIGSRADLFTTMDGLLDDVRIYNEVLPPEAIRELSGAEPPPEPPADLLTASIYSVSSELVTNFNRPAENVVNGSGLNPDGSHSITPDGTMWLNAGNGCCGDEPDDLAPAAEIVFDLGSELAIDRMKVWNYNEDLPGRPELLQRGAAVADIEIAGEDLMFSTFAAGVELDIAPGTALEDFGQIIDFSGSTARYVRLTLLENHGGDNDFIGLSEVQFFKSLINGDFNGDGVLNDLDIDALTAEVNAGTDNPDFDLNGDNVVNATDRMIWLDDLKQTWIGDSDMNGEFNSSDLVQIFQRGQYEDGIDGNSRWGDGDWNGDNDFNTSDLVAAFQQGGFEQGPRAAVAAQTVPEPTFGAMMLLLSIAPFSRWLRRG